MLQPNEVRKTVSIQTQQLRALGNSADVKPTGTLDRRTLAGAAAVNPLFNQGRLARNLSQRAICTAPDRLLEFRNTHGAPCEPFAKQQSLGRRYDAEHLGIFCSLHCPAARDPTTRLLRLVWCEIAVE